MPGDPVMGGKPRRVRKKRKGLKFIKRTGGNGILTTGNRLMKSKKTPLLPSSVGGRMGRDGWSNGMGGVRCRGEILSSRASRRPEERGALRRKKRGRKKIGGKARAGATIHAS